MAGRARRRGLEQPLPRQPRPASLGQPLRQRRPGPPGDVREGARYRAAPAPRYAVRLPGRRARHDQPVFAHGRRTSATSSRSTTSGDATAAGQDPEAVMAALRHKSRDNARTPMQWDDSHARRLHRRCAVAGGEPQLPARSTRPRRSTTPTPSSPTTAAWSRCATPTRWWCTAPTRCCCPTTSRSTRSPGPTAAPTFWSWPTCPVEDGVVADESVSGPWSSAEHVLGNVPGSSAGVDVPLLPWEVRVYRR